MTGLSSLPSTYGSLAYRSNIGLIAAYLQTGIWTFALSVMVRLVLFLHAGFVLGNASYGKAMATSGLR